MTQTINAGPIPAVGWDATEDEWLAARQHGLGGSDILAVLGFSNYRTPWDVWAEKTGVRSWQDEGSAAADLGKDLEPWLLDQAQKHLGVPVAVPAYRTYQHPVFGWQRCSPDGITADNRLVECKTAGLGSGFGIPDGWADGAIPLGYEFQVRWSLYVMNADIAEIFALIAGMGVQRRTVIRDLAVEHELVAQVTDWHRRHVIGGEEPALGAVDNPLLARLYPTANGNEIDLSDSLDALELWHAYRDALAREKTAKAEKETAGAAIKKLLGDNERGVIDGRTVATWSNKKGSVDWPRMVAALVEQHGIPAPNPDEYRKPASRSLNVKDAA